MLDFSSLRPRDRRRWACVHLVADANLVASGRLLSASFFYPCMSHKLFLVFVVFAVVSAFVFLTFLCGLRFEVESWVTTLGRSCFLDKKKVGKVGSARLYPIRVR